MKLTPCMYVNDYETVRRTLKERLFSRPWTPLVKYKRVYSPMAYQLGDETLVSYQTYQKVINGLIDTPLTAKPRFDNPL